MSTSSNHERIRRTVATLVAVPLLGTALASCSSTSEMCAEWLKPEYTYKAAVGVVVIPGMHGEEDLQGRLDVMNAVVPPAEAAESWATWKSHLEQAQSDTVNGTPYSELTWFPASDEAEQAGGVVQDLYSECI